MSTNETETQHNAIKQLNAEYRAHHFFTTVKKEASLYVLHNGTTMLMLNASDDNNEPELCAIPVWPSADFAQEYTACDPTYTSYAPKAVPLSVFLDKWLPTLGDKVEFAIFPVSADEETLLCNTTEIAEEFAKLADA